MATGRMCAFIRELCSVYLHYVLYSYEEDQTSMCVEESERKERKRRDRTETHTSMHHHTIKEFQTVFRE